MARRRTPRCSLGPLFVRHSSPAPSSVTSNSPMNYRPYECRGVTPAMLTRRDLLRTVSAGFGWLAFKGLSATAAAAENRNPLAPKTPHFPARAKRVIFLCMQGGPAHQDTFDYKPKLTEDNGKPLVAKGGGAKLFG